MSHPILLAQCKAYQPLEEIVKVVENILKIHSPTSFHVHIALPYSFIQPISEKFGEQGVKVGAELLLDTDEKSFTASCAGKILEKAGAQFVLVGTPQDRTSHDPNTNHLKNKVKVALDVRIPPFVCISETLQEHHEGKSKEVLVSQLKDALDGISPEELKSLYLVYNAEWISRTPWEANSPELHEAYKTFNEALHEVLGPDTIPKNHCILAVPAYSKELPQLITSLNPDSTASTGYSIGILGLSSSSLNPLSDPPK